MARSLAVARRRARRRHPVLELGCGGGEDSETLVSSGLGLVALDLSERAVAAARTRVPAARFLCQDVRDPLPVQPRAELLLVDGQPKRFFDRGDLEGLFGTGWRTLSVAETSTAKYGLPKQLWEVVLEKCCHGET